jgi:large subunit ribosomal protein L9
MAKTNVILTRNISGLGAESDHIEVAAGYARNYLIPQGYAVTLDRANSRRLEVLKARRKEREAQELANMQALAKSVGSLVLIIKVKTGDEGRLFGSVSAANIIDELKHQFDVELERRKVLLEKAIRDVGDHEVDLHLHTDIHAKLKVRVESTNPLAVAFIAEKTRAKEEASEAAQA